MKKYIQENYRVRAIPERHFGYETTEKDCEKLKKEIERHCDIEEVYVEHDTRCICEFCGSEWEEEWDNGMPFCCNKAQDEYEKLREEALNNAKNKPILKEPLNDTK